LEITEEMGPRVRGHHPNCERAQRKTTILPPSVNKADRPKPGEEGYLEFDANSQMYHRPGTLDYYVIHEVKSYERMGILPSDIVLYVGAHIGGFTTQALKRGATVYAFEPDPENYDILAKNTEKYGEQVVLSPRAVTSDGAESATLYLNVGANTGTHSLLPSRGRDTVQVETEDFQALLNRVQPTVLKCDIEGGEYALDWSTLPDSIRLICMELHRTKKGLHEKSIELANHVSSLGYEYTKVPKLEGGAWAVLAIWQKSRVPAASVEPELAQV
jgi:FkbM family methyltransferase